MGNTKYYLIGIWLITILNLLSYDTGEGYICSGKNVTSAVIASIILAFYGAVSGSKDKSDETSVKESTENVPEQIEKLSELKEKGIITEEEFEEKKKKLLEKV